MANCHKKKKGNLYESDNLPDVGPYTGTVEKVCKDGNSYSKQSVSYSSLNKPEDVEATRRGLEAQVQDNNGGSGIFDGMASVFKSVFGVSQKPSKEQINNSIQSSKYNGHGMPQEQLLAIEDQQWPNPEIDNNNEGHLFDHGDMEPYIQSSTSGGAKRKRTVQQNGRIKKRSTVQAKKKVKSVKKSIPKRSKKKSAVVKKQTHSRSKKK